MNDDNNKFYTELYKLLDNDSDNESDTNKCLITDEILIDKFVKLPCGHSFNYIPLYNDIKNHKTKFNHMESTSSKLTIHEIRCPYCRSIHGSLLPYYEELGLAKVHGVNYLEVNHVPHVSHKACSFIENHTPCKSYAFKINVYDKKLYCYPHNAIVHNMYVTKNKEEKQKAKEEKQKAKEEKQKAKEEKQKAKDDKQKAKDDKQKAKEEAKKQKVTNVVVGNIVVENVVEDNAVVSNIVVTGCVSVLKTGPCKGKVCNKRIYNDSMCKLHYCVFTK
jgi:hypothetical protein